MEYFIKVILIFGSIGHLLLIAQNISLIGDMYQSGESVI